MRDCLIALACFLSTAAFSHEPPPAPWLTGPLLAPTGTVTPLGHFNVQAYGYFTQNLGSYDANWGKSRSGNRFFSFNQQLVSYVGLAPWMDLNIIPQFSVNSSRGKTICAFGDLTAGFDFQLYPAEAHPWFPGVKIAVTELFPTGRYQNLSPAYAGADQSGFGTFGTGINLVFYKIYPLTGPYFISVTASGLYQLNSSVRVHGLNAYGGGLGTDGTVDTGNLFQGILSFEFTLSQNWVFAIDNVYTHIGSSPFSGESGGNATGLPSMEQISFAPAVEYNFSGTLGIIAGCWFTAAGRNAPRFASGVAELNYYY